MPVRKLAFFVEGQTELIFVRRLLEEIIGRQEIQFRVEYQKWGKLHYLSIEGDDDARFLVYLVDCRQDERVLSEILCQQSSLIDSGFERIFGLQDLHPIAREKLPDLIHSIDTELAHCTIPTDLFVAVMEIEAWFVSEHTHFQQIDPRLTMDFIENELNFNPSVEMAENLDFPSDFLDEAYQLVGQSYKKKKYQVEATVECLDFCSIYLELPDRVPEIARLIQEINHALD